MRSSMNTSSTLGALHLALSLVAGPARAQSIVFDTMQSVEMRRHMLVGAVLSRSRTSEEYRIRAFLVNPRRDTLTVTYYCHSIGIALATASSPDSIIKKWYPTAGQMRGVPRTCITVVFTRRIAPQDTLFLKEVEPRIVVDSAAWAEIPPGRYYVFAMVHAAEGVRVNIGITPEGRRLNGREGPPFAIAIGTAIVR